METGHKLKFFSSILIAAALLILSITSRVTALFDKTTKDTVTSLVNGGNVESQSIFSDTVQSIQDRGGIEVSGLRTESSRYYDLPGGKKAVLISSAPIQYQTEGGIYTLVDNRINPASIETKYAYRNAANAFSVYFPAEADGGTDILFETPNREKIRFWRDGELWYVPPGGKGVLLFQAEHTRGKPDDNVIRYADRYPGISESFTVRYEGVKHNFEIAQLPETLKNNSDGTLEFSEVVVLPEGAQLSVNGFTQRDDFATAERIEIVDAGGNQLGYFPQPWIRDNAIGDLAFEEMALSYKVRFIDPYEIRIAVQVPIEWLTAPNRVYPLLLDPSVYYYEIHNYDDCTQVDATHLDYTEDYLGVGYYSGSGLPYLITYMTFHDVNIPPGSTIDAASLYFRAYESTSDTSSFKWQFEDTDNAQNCTHDYPSTRDYVKPFYYISPYTTSWVAGRRYSVGRLDTGLQAVISRPGWTFGNNVGLAWSAYEATGSYRSITSYGGGSAPYLYVEYTPPDDNYEENDSLGESWTPGWKWEQTWLCGIDGCGIQADEDWYQIDVASGYERVLIDCQFTDSEGDINIALYDSSVTLLASSTSTTDNEYIDIPVPSDDTYYIKVYGEDTSSNYDLWWDDVPREPEIRIEPPVGAGDEIIFSEYASTAPKARTESQTYFSTAFSSDHTGVKITYQSGPLQHRVVDEYDLFEVEDHKAELSGKPDQPYLPVRYLYLLVPPDSRVKDLEIIDTSSRLLPGTYTIYPAPTPVSICSNPGYEPLSGHKESTNNDLPGSGFWPPEPVEYVDRLIIRGHKLLIFKISPIQYNPETGEVLHHDHIRFAPVLAQDDPVPLSYDTPAGEFASFTRQNADNPDDFESLYPQNQTYSPTSPDVEYLIITNSALESSFQALADWKSSRGVPAEVISTAFIYSNYSGVDNQEKIKYAIRDYAQNHGTIWILLGGDNTIVPDRDCLGKFLSQEDTTLPTDLYYAGLDDINWNDDGDGKACEPADDSVDMGVDVFIGRAPVRTTGDVDAFTNKVTTYEENPPASGFAEEMILMGAELWNTWGGRSDIDWRSEKLYEDHIDPYWDPERVRLYDTNTDFGGPDYDVTSANVTDQINDGYNFLFMASHGLPRLWNLESYEVFSTTHAAGLTNLGEEGIVYTIACLTNAFDDDATGAAEPCLSEAFLRNPNGGAVAYIGSSREGWDSDDEEVDFGASFLYASQFYEQLFSGVLDPGSGDVNPNDYAYHLGAVHAGHKMYWAGWSFEDGPVRWLQFSINLMGDPQMEVLLRNTQYFTIHNDGTADLQITDILKQSGSAWLNVETPDPIPFWIAPGESVPVKVTVDKSGLPIATYNDRLLVYSNDPDRSPYPAGSSTDPNGGVDVRLEVINSPPSLEWVGEASYISDGLYPDIGDVNDSYLYKIKYSDPDGDPPFLMGVSIRKGGVDIQDSPFIMTCESGDYTAGVICSFTKEGLDEGLDYSYVFFGWDMRGGLANITIEQDAPDVYPYEANILLVDDDNQWDKRPYYTEALDALGKRYHIWDTENSDNEPDAPLLDLYQKVIWFSAANGSEYAGPGPGSEAALGAWLDSGGRCLFLSSQFYYEERGFTPFMDTYLGAADSFSLVNNAAVSGAGSVFNGLGPYSLTDGYYGRYNYQTSPNATAELAFSGDQGDAAVAKDTGVYKTTFWGFSFWAIDTEAGRVEAMAAFFDWCRTTTFTFGPLVIR